MSYITWKDKYNVFIIVEHHFSKSNDSVQIIDLKCKKCIQVKKKLHFPFDSSPATKNNCFPAHAQICPIYKKCVLSPYPSSARAEIIVYIKCTGCIKITKAIILIYVTLVLHITKIYTCVYNLPLLYGLDKFYICAWQVLLCTSDSIVLLASSPKYITTK